MEGKTKPASAVATWWVAVRPFAYTGSVLPVLFGMALAHEAGLAPRWGRFVLTLLGVLSFHTAANLLNDYHDFRRGTDKTVNPASGALVRGWLSDHQVRLAALLCLGAGMGFGCALVWLAGWPVLLLGVIGAVLSLGYTRAGFCLKYAGLGDLTIFLAFGVLPVFGTYWVQAETFSWQPIVWSVPLVSFTIGILHANNWRDLGSDTGAGCRTLATRLGERGSSNYYRVLIVGPFVLVGLYVLAERLGCELVRAPLTALAVLVALPKAVQLGRIQRDAAGDAFLMLDALTAQLHLLFGLLLSVAFALSPHLPWG